MLLQSKITRKLATSSLDYLRIGLKKFHEIKKGNHENYQAPVGNICIAIELLLKAVIADRTFVLLFSNLPLEVKVKLTDKQSDKYIQLPPYHRQNIESFSLNTKQLNNCISIFYSLHPSIKQEFRPFLKTIRDIRNISVHGAFPEFQKYSLEWVAYSAISLFKYLKSEGYSFLRFSNLTDEDEKFYENFDKERNEKVQESIRKAQNKAKNVSRSFIIEVEPDWNLFITDCPICKNEALLEGYTDLEYETLDDENVALWLNFYAESFECDQCGLELSGIYELDLAGLKTVYERDDEDIDKWLKEQQEEFEAEQYL